MRRARRSCFRPTTKSRIAYSRGCTRSTSSSVATGAAGQFDIFILSDTTDPDIFIAEEAAFLALRQRLPDARVYYRHRPKNDAKKAGNIAEWLQRFGGHYEQLIVLDADSLMTGDTLVRLVAAMERNPGVGLIQTFPVMVNATTPFARVQQFAGRLYGPLIAYGLAWWHGADSNYWGHNAVLRTRAFAESAGLPVLSGPRPIGGHILSHDFVEAALMRRAGWAVVMAPALPGSYEECPPSLTEYAARDRRWCQGNLQHAGVLSARGLHWVTRLHLATGIGSYVAAPLWLLFLFIGILISLQAQFIRPEYFPKTFTLYPQWPAQDPVRAAYVFAGTMALLLLPKLLGYLAMLPDRATRARIWRRAPRVHQHAHRDRDLGADRAGDDADPVDLGHPDRERARQRLAGATARRRQPAACRHHAPLRLAHGIRIVAGSRRIRGVVFAVRLDDAGDRRPDPRDPAGAMERQRGCRPKDAPAQAAAHPRGKRTAADPGTRQCACA